MCRAGLSVNALLQSDSKLSNPTEILLEKKKKTCRAGLSVNALLQSGSKLLNPTEILLEKKKKRAEQVCQSTQHFYMTLDVDIHILYKVCPILRSGEC